MKDEFVASVSCEPHTPLTAVLGHLEMLTKSEDLPPQVHRQLDVVRRNAPRLRSPVSDLLHVAQAHAGTLQIERDTVDVVGLVEDALEAATPAATPAGSRSCPTSRLTSRRWSTPGGETTLRLRGVDDTLEVGVPDSGVGMSDEEAAQAFAVSSVAASAGAALPGHRTRADQRPLHRR